MMQANALKDYVGNFIKNPAQPGTPETEEFWDWLVENNSMTVYHPVGKCLYLFLAPFTLLPFFMSSLSSTGTAKCGTDEMSVVNSELIVRGTKNLRVVDASIMPTLTSGNTNAPAIMIGEKGADIIAKKYV